MRLQQLEGRSRDCSMTPALRVVVRTAAAVVVAMAQARKGKVKETMARVAVEVMVREARAMVKKERVMMALAEAEGMALKVMAMVMSGRAVAVVPVAVQRTALNAQAMLLA